MRLYTGLVHYPVYNKNHQRIASAITTVDLHDLARLARTYDVKRFFVITPLAGQQVLAERIRRHWTQGYGAGYNLHRKEAFECVAVVPSLDSAIHAVVATDASRQGSRSISWEEAGRLIRNEKGVILLFGTAWGLDTAVLRRADYVLDPISGRGDYNHLSVRAAAAIILDRLAGR
jgi:hypothetical protein